jgi:hypothetical protein
LRGHEAPIPAAQDQDGFTGRIRLIGTSAGGPRSRNLTPSQREADREPRLTISEELGHEREQIASDYLWR